MKLIYDSRERWFYEDGYENFVGKEIEVERCQLDIGDFVFEHEGNTCLIIERKTVADLLSSIKDGRFATQKNSMERVLNGRVYYIIEGVGNITDISSMSKYNSTEKKSLVSAIINLQFCAKNSIHVITSTDKHNTALFLKELSSRLLKSPEKYIACHVGAHDTSDAFAHSPGTETQTQTRAEAVPIANVVQGNSVKKSSTPGEFMVSSLVQVRGVSKNISDAICREFNAESLVDLCAKMTTFSFEDLRKKISEIKVNGRRIGNSASLKVISTFGVVDTFN